MTGNGDLPPKGPGTEKKPEVTKPAAAARPPASTAAGSGQSVKDRISDYEKVVRLNGLVRITFPLLSLSLIVVFLIATWLTIWGAFPERAISQETIVAGEQLMPYFNRILKTFADDVAPEFVEEFEIKLAEAGDSAIQRLSTEITELHHSNEAFIKETAASAILDQKESHKTMLRTLYPELVNDPVRLEKYTVAVNKAFQHWTIAYMTRIMADYFETMGRINETVIKSYSPRRTATGDQPKVLEAEMLELFMELLNAAYDEPGLAPANMKQAPPAGEPAPAAEDEPAPAEEATEEPGEEAPAEATAEPAGAPAENL